MLVGWSLNLFAAPTHQHLSRRSWRSPLRITCYSVESAVRQRVRINVYLNKVGGGRYIPRSSLMHRELFYSLFASTPISKKRPVAVMYHFLFLTIGNRSAACAHQRLFQRDPGGRCASRASLTKCEPVRCSSTSTSTATNCRRPLCSTCHSNDSEWIWNRSAA